MFLSSQLFPFPSFVKKIEVLPQMLVLVVSLLSFSTGALTSDADFTSAEKGALVPYETTCELTVLSSGTSTTSETDNGDVIFIAGRQQILLLELHPELEGVRLAVGGFDAKWIAVSFPDARDNMVREYSFKFGKTEFLVLCEGDVLISIPYDQYTENPDEFLSTIDSLKFDMKRAADIKFSKKCLGSIQDLPKLIVYEHPDQEGASITLSGPYPDFRTMSFNDKADSVWAVNSDWELYSGYSYSGTRFFVKEGQEMNAKNSNSYSSARPANCRYVSDPTTAKIRVSTSSHYQYTNHEILSPVADLETLDLTRKITSVIVDKGDWELYSEPDYQGSRLLLKEGTMVEHLKHLGFDNKAKSMRPLCATYKGLEKCGLIRVEIEDTGDLEPQLTGTEIIGSQSSGSCYGPASHEISLTQVHAVEESFSLETFEEKEINWEVSVSVEVESSAKFLGSGASVTMGVSVGAGGARTMGTAKTTETVNINEKEHGQVTEFDVPGAGILFGIVDRYELDKSSVPVKMHLSCPDGRNKTIDSTMALKKVSYGASDFWSLTGQFTKEACRQDRELPECVSRVRKNFANFIGQKAEIEDAFEACFANGKGEF